MRRICVLLLFVGFAVLAGRPHAGAQSPATPATRPIFGASCPTCPWGAMGDAVKEAMQPLGYDVQICYSCGGPARSVRLVADGSNATPPQNPAADARPTPQG